MLNKKIDEAIELLGYFTIPTDCNDNDNSPCLRQKVKELYKLLLEIKEDINGLPH